MGSNTTVSGIYRDRLSPKYIFADFDESRHNRFSGTLELLHALLSEEGVKTVTKKFVESQNRANSSPH